MAAKTPFYIDVPNFLVKPLISRFCPALRDYSLSQKVVFDEEVAAGSCLLFPESGYPSIVVEQHELLDFVKGFKKVLDEDLPKTPVESKNWTYESFAEEAKRTRNPELTLNDRLINNALGLSGEVGEFVDLVKKVLFHRTTVPTEKIMKELGDIQYYWAETVATLGELLKFTVQDVLETNSKKLRERYPNGFSFSAANERKDEKVEKSVSTDTEKADLYKLYSALMDDVFGPRS
jgi:NTP pyrophosphatase (non-canonical NTP hydrolase)